MPAWSAVVLVLISVRKVRAAAGSTIPKQDLNGANGYLDSAA